MEAALTQHPTIRAAVVVAVGSDHAHQRLVAYVVSEQQSAPSAATLSQFLLQKLPSYMVPSAFVVLEVLPLSANGKVDRVRIAEQYRDRTHQAESMHTVEVAYVAPESDLEQKIAIVWQEILQLDRVGINDNFFDIGGNSLLITKVHSKLRKLFPEILESISLVELFRHPTIYALVNYLNQSESSSLLSQDSKKLAEKLKVGRQRLKQRFNKSIAISNDL